MITLPISSAVLGILFLLTFALCFVLFYRFSNFLPLDRGRELAFDGDVSKGKRTSAGILFVLPVCILSVVFFRLSIESYLYILLIVMEMLAGYFDDNSKKPWGELKKGLIDLFISCLGAYVFIYFNNTPFMFPLLGFSLTLPPIIAFVFAVALIWGSINVTNICDGVDGLSSSLISMCLVFFLAASSKMYTMEDFSPVTMLFLAGLLAYSYFNASPSTHLMGDAGSRALGVLIAITALKSRAPLLYIPFAISIIFDGMSSLLKLTVLRVTKYKSFMRNIRTPLHDHVRDNLGFSDTQTVLRFSVFQFVISLFFYMFI